LPFVGYQLVAESWLITFEIEWASKYVEAFQGLISAIAVLERRCWISILVSVILGFLGKN
jgi:hypothetical protein